MNDVFLRHFNGDGILGHDKRLESSAPCYSQSFYWWIFKENQALL
jgi:hypothetical protein